MSSKCLSEAPEVFSRRLGVSEKELSKFSRVLTAEGTWRKKIAINEIYNCEEITEDWELKPKNGVYYV